MCLQKYNISLINNVETIPEFVLVSNYDCNSKSFHPLG